MKISDIYEKFGTPPNLQEHMFRVYAIVSHLEKHWLGIEKIDWELVKQTSLLHDLGNIVKFDFENHPEFLGKEIANIDYWRDFQRKIIEKFGNDDHLVTTLMLREIGVSESVIDIIQNKSFGESVATEKSNNWPLKILYYADLRVLPFGIGTIEERISDVRNRMPKYTVRPDFEDLVASCRQIEIQIQKNIDIPVSQITDKTVNYDSTHLDFYFPLGHNQQQ